MCGVIGVAGVSPANQTLFDGLTLLQHRGQDAAGMITCEGTEMFMRKDLGLVREVFHTRHMRQLAGAVGIGHVRYPTAGCDGMAEAQPFYVNAPYGIALAHNGNLTNAADLAQELIHRERRHLNTSSDSEVLLNVFAHELQRVGGVVPSVAEIFDAIRAMHRRVVGAYAVVGLIAGVGLFAFRDPLGIRPLAFGRRQENGHSEHLVASESVAVDAMGFEHLRDLAPGEAMVVLTSGEAFFEQCADDPGYAPCIFEYVYLARPDSIIDDVSVYRARLRMGERLAEKIQRDWSGHDIDVVIPIPDTSRTAALELAQKLGLPFREGFVKNRYVGRTFIMPGQGQRKQSVRQKLNPIGLEFKDKNVLLVDDSIVRGTTSERIIQLARDAGARKVYFASAAPPVRHPNVYGIDMPAASELIAHGRSVDEICQAIGADRLIYQDLDALIESVREGNPSLKRFDTSCFTGEYVTNDVTPEYLQRLAAARADGPRAERRSRDIVAVGLHNLA